MEDNYKKIRTYTLITNIVDSVITGIAGVIFILGLIASFMTWGPASDAMGNVSDVDPEGVTAGFEVLWNLFGGFALGFMLVIGVAMAIIGAFLTIVFLLVIIHGYITYGKMKYRYECARPLYKKSVRRDCIFKILLNGVMAVGFFLFLISGEVSFALIIGLLLLTAVVGLCIANLCRLREKS